MLIESLSLCFLLSVQDGHYRLTPPVEVEIESDVQVRLGRLLAAAGSMIAAPHTSRIAFIDVSDPDAVTINDVPVDDIIYGNITAVDLVPPMCVLGLGLEQRVCVLEESEEQWRVSTFLEPADDDVI